jgi:hypothetical protein
MVMRVALFLSRHPELVSGSMSRSEVSVDPAGWMLKQVQHDEVGEAAHG